MITRLLAFLLIAEAMFAGVHVAGLIPQLSGYDAVAIALILARGLLGALQFVSGWLIATHRPQGVALAPWALLGAAVVMILGVGFSLAPTTVYHWLRWQVAGGYVLYAVSAEAYLRTRR